MMDREQAEILVQLMALPTIVSLGVTALGIAIQHRALANYGFHALIAFMVGFGLVVVFA